MLSFEKQMGDLGPARDEAENIDVYYKEREWRIIPFKASLMSNSLSLDVDNNIFYNFRRKDIKIIIVPNNEIRNDAFKWFLDFTDNEDERLRSFAEDIPPIIVYDDLKLF